LNFEFQDKEVLLFSENHLPRFNCKPENWNYVKKGNG